MIYIYICTVCVHIVCTYIYTVFDTQVHNTDVSEGHPVAIFKEYTLKKLLFVVTVQPTSKSLLHLS